MLETERLYIREFKMEDAMTMAAYRNKEEVRLYQSWSHYSYIKAKKRIEYCMQHPFNGQIGNYQLAITLKDTEILIGDIFMEVISADALVLGYTLDSAFWSLGYASEALQAFFHFIKEEYGFTTILCYVYADNVRSIKLLKRHGFIEFERSRYMGDVGYKKIL